MRKSSIIKAVLLSAVLSASFLVAGLGCDDGKMAVERLHPNAGRLEGDVDVEIQGRNFRDDIGYEVWFGTSKAKQVSLRDPSTLIATTPDHRQEGPVDVRIIADDGHTFVVHQGFRYVDEAVNVLEGLGKQGKAPSKVIH